MTREEQRIKAGNEAFYHIPTYIEEGLLDGSFSKIFALGAKWADEHPAKKGGIQFDKNGYALVDGMLIQEGIYRPINPKKFEHFSTKMSMKEIEQWAEDLKIYLDFIQKSIYDIIGEHAAQLLGIEQTKSE